MPGLHVQWRAKRERTPRHDYLGIKMGVIRSRLLWVSGSSRRLNTAWLRGDLGLAPLWESGSGWRLQSEKGARTDGSSGLDFSRRFLGQERWKPRGPVIGGALGVLLTEQGRLVRINDNAPERRLAECPLAEA